MRKALALLLLLSAALAYPQVAFTTERFQTDTFIRKDRSITVTEAITVNFSQSRRGITRQLQREYSLSSGGTRKVRYDVEEAQLSTGAAFRDVPVQTANRSGNVEIRLGDPNKTISGRATYRFRYRVEGALNEPKGTDHTAFFWNVVPVGWPTAINRVSGSISYPQPTGTVTARFWVGQPGTRYGFQTSTAGVKEGDPRSISVSFRGKSHIDFTVPRPLGDQEGVTASVLLPKGTVEPPPKSIPVPEQIRARLAGFPNNPASFAIPLIPVAVLLFFARRSFGKHRPLTVRFDPPEGFGSAETGFLVDERVMSRHIVSLIISLGQKGALALHHGPGGTQDISLHLLGLDHAKPLTAAESSLYRSLEGFGSAFVTPEMLRGNFGREYHHIASVVEAEVNNGRYRNKSVFKSGMGCGCAIAVIWLAAIGAAWVGWQAGIGLVVAVVAGLVILAKVSPWTELGELRRSEALGLREFITRAQERELNYMADKMPSQAMFENLLPYAVAFGAVEQWSNAFRGIDIHQPEWFVYDDPVGDIMWSAILFSSLTDFDQGWGSAFESASGFNNFGEGGGWGDGGSGFGDGDGGGFDFGGGGWSDGGGVGDGGGGGGGGDW